MRLGLAGVPAVLGWFCVAVFRFLLRSVGVLAVVTGFSGLGSGISKPSPEWFEFPAVLESWLAKGIGLWPEGNGIPNPDI